MPQTRAGRIAVAAAAGTGLFAIAYSAWALFLLSGATEGAVPDISRIGLPAQVDIVDETRECASGGCWVTITVRPPAGQSAEELASEIGASPQLELPGSIFDPRTVWVWAEPVAGDLALRADYWSQQHAP